MFNAADYLPVSYAFDSPALRESSNSRRETIAEVNSIPWPPRWYLSDFKKRFVSLKDKKRQSAILSELGNPSTRRVKAAYERSSSESMRVIYSYFKSWDNMDLMKKDYAGYQKLVEDRTKAQDAELSALEARFSGFACDIENIDREVRRSRTLLGRSHAAFLSSMQ